MTAFTTVPDDVLEPGDPIRSIDIIALRDNPIAMFEGAAGAPRLVGNAVSVFPGTYPVLTVTASDAFSIENGINFTTFATDGKNNTSFVTIQQYTVNTYTGTIRTRCNTGNFNGLPNLQVKVSKNNVLVATYSGQVGLNTVTDLSVVPDDVIKWEARMTQSSGAYVQSTTKSNAATASNGYVLRNLFAPSV